MNTRDLAENVKAGVIVSTTTTGSGMGVVLDLIPDDIGKLATVVGIFLSLVLIYNHLRKGHIERRNKNVEFMKAQLEIELLKNRLGGG